MSHSGATLVRVAKAILYIAGRPFVYTFAFVVATIAAGYGAVWRRRHPDELPVELKSTNDGWYVRFQLLSVKSRPVLGYDSYPMRWGFFAYPDIHAEDVIGAFKTQHNEKEMLEHVRERQFSPERRSDFIQVFMAIAHPKIVERKSLEQQLVWDDDWDRLNTEIVLKWLTMGGDVNTPSRGHVYSDGKTLLYFATYFGHPKMRQMLIDNGAAAVDSGELGNRSLHE